MNSVLQGQESQSETVFHRIFESIQRISAYCLDCIMDFCLNVWDITSTFFQDVWDWTSENLCYCCNRNRSEIRQVADQKNRKLNLQSGTTTANAIISKSTSLSKSNSSDPDKLIGNNIDTTTKTTGQHSTPKVKIKTSQINVLTTTTPAVNVPNLKYITNQQASSIKAPPEPTTRSGMIGTSLESLTQALGAKVANYPTIQPTLVDKQSPKQVQSLETPETPTIKILPPKIEFVETGSIFGDRKKPTFDQNMLQIENGRFRSPGTSKIVRGPGGRSIRVSFVSGFPAIKSIDSRSSLSQSISKTSKKSVDSTQMQTNLTGHQSVGSLDSATKESL